MKEKARVNPYSTGFHIPGQGQSGLGIPVPGWNPIGCGTQVKGKLDYGYGTIEPGGWVRAVLRCRCQNG
jgi:hypothetical protein